MERTVEQPIIADTSGLVSLATETPIKTTSQPAQAAARLREASRPIILPVDVLVAETVKCVRQKKRS